MIRGSAQCSESCELLWIDIEAVWDTLRNNIPSFKKQIVNILKSERGAKKRMIDASPVRIILGLPLVLFLPA